MLAFDIFLFTGAIVTTPLKTTLAHFQATIQMMLSLQSPLIHFTRKSSEIPGP